MRKWILVAGLVLLGALALAACGDDGDTNTESAQDGESLPPVGDDFGPPGDVGYRVTVSFGENAEDTELEEVRRLLAILDPSTEYVIQESFPSTAIANLTGAAEGFCETVVSDLEELSYVSEASCGPQLEPGDLDQDDPAADVPDLQPTNGSERDDGVSTSPACTPDTPECDDMVIDTDLDGGTTGENELPIAPPDIGVPLGQFQITVRFNETVLQDHLDEVGARIQDFDPDAEYVVQESFPPVGVANFVAETEDVCLALAQELEAESFVDSVSCGPQLEPGDPDPDEPVVSDLE